MAGRVIAPPPVVVEGLHRRYGERAALEDVTFTVPHGARAVLVGPNGAGKTTLLRVLCGLLRPHEGRVRVAGHDLPGAVANVRQKVGYLGHDSLLHGELSARENLTFYARLYGADGSRVAAMLDAVGMALRADEPVRTLSRGLLQRVACARVCLHRPSLLLLDEPFANLDPAATQLLRGVLDSEAGPTRILVTHDIDGAVADADVVIALRAGRCAVAADGPSVADVAEVFA